MRAPRGALFVRRQEARPSRRAPTGWLARRWVALLGQKMGSYAIIKDCTYLVTPTVLQSYVTITKHGEWTSCTRPRTASRCVL